MIACVILITMVFNDYGIPCPNHLICPYFGYLIFVFYVSLLSICSCCASVIVCPVICLSKHNLLERNNKVTMNKFLQKQMCFSSKIL